MVRLLSDFGLAAHCREFGGSPTYLFSVVFYYGFRSWRFGASTTDFYYGFLLRIFYYGFWGRGGGPEDAEEQLLRRAREARWAVMRAAGALFFLRFRILKTQFPKVNLIVCAPQIG